jgi:5-methylcytosine-specific restriction endonuclease McrA
MARDRRRCGYRGAQATTIDHVPPRSRGGRNTWLSTVAACGGCNQRNGDRTPAEARMPLGVSPHAPTWAALAAR